ncbi:MAG: DNA helicase [Bacteroidia bacterium]|nr:MAG: DNA helicase [Bacteroidia bacterium]
MDLLNSLNEAQKNAVMHTEGPVMIIAGAGSGKTTVLTRRISYILYKNLANPFEILALTFTNKAAQEMRDRIEKLVGPKAHYLWMGTFHSIFSKILRLEGHFLGFSNSFSIYDTDDSQSLIKTIIKELNLDTNKFKHSSIHKVISSCKNQLIDAAKFEEQYANTYGEEICKIFKIYEKRCKEANAMDFDDLLVYTCILFKNFPEILEKYQQRFKYILIDEYQDTNHVQYLISKMLAAKHQNICVVGDDAQSIYRFRGADIQNILNFQKDYPHSKIFKLELNYRSTATIVDAANSVIANNQFQLEKKCFTINEIGEKIKIIENNNELEEAQRIATYIREQKVRYSYTNQDFAVLYRTNSQSRLIEDALRKSGIPYRIYGGLSFYRRQEVKDALAYLKLSVNPYDEEAIKRVINYPARGIGEATMEKLLQFAAQNQMRLWDVIYNIRQLGVNRFTAAVESFAKLIAYNYQTVQNMNAYEATEMVIKNSGILSTLKNSDDPQDHARWENVIELINAAKEFVNRVEENENSLPYFLQETSLFTDQDEQEEEPHVDKVTLMTIHASKGLEFTSLIVAGLEENLFPNARVKNGLSRFRRRKKTVLCCNYTS